MAREGLLDGRRAIRLRLVPALVGPWVWMDVVLCRVAVGNAELLVDLKSKHVRYILTALLVKRHCIARRWESVITNLGAVSSRSLFDIDKDIRELAVLNHGVFGDQIWIGRTTRRIGRGVDLLRGRRRARERDGAT